MIAHKNNQRGHAAASAGPKGIGDFLAELEGTQAQELQHLANQFVDYLPQEFAGWQPRLQWGYVRMLKAKQDKGELQQPEAFSQESVPATRERIVKHFNLTTLDDLGPHGHMNPVQRQWFEDLLALVRRWRVEVDALPGLSMILHSRSVGIGKTHIAKAVNDSFRGVMLPTGAEATFTAGEPNFMLVKRSRFVEAKPLMEMMDREEYHHGMIMPRHISCLVLDDVGREGSLRYEKRDAEMQAEERQHRYFSIINHAYERRNGENPVSLFITSNLSGRELEELFGPAAWSRLQEMCPPPYIVEVPALPDYRRIRSGRS